MTLLHLLLYLLLRIDRRSAYYGFILLHVVNKFPLFILVPVIDYVDSLAVGSRGNARNSARVSRSESGS